MELLRERLIDCGWKDEMKAICRFYLLLFPFFRLSFELRLCPNVADMLMLHFLDADGKLVVFSIMIMAYIKKKGRNNVTVDDLVHLITPKGRASVPDNVKADLLQRIRTFLMSAAL
ncbi:Detected protein of confused Function [Hibiscus syriacus]|uniref:Transcription and mRNA export factor ENY2 n=1 Tax=Hibiscus syriacus TaxID=106335 RepID=A0A6A3CJR6_HIBSY|nr:Detected protein of confused Function [Hibiscus syriacus]